LNGAIILRSFQPADQPAAKRLIQEGLGEHFGFIDEMLNPDIDDITASYIVPGHTFVVAEEGGRLVGTGALITAELRVAQMVRVSVCRECRKRGIGRAIVARLLQVARENGLGRVQVETNKDWWDAIGLYNSHGFHEYARDEVSVYMALEIQINHRGMS
jgi:N-acetylglutamate synthase-like GNAT family acetyltransferase